MLMYSNNPAISAKICKSHDNWVTREPDNHGDYSDDLEESNED